MHQQMQTQHQIDAQDDESTDAPLSSVASAGTAQPGSPSEYEPVGSPLASPISVQRVTVVSVRPMDGTHWQRAATGNDTASVGVPSAASAPVEPAAAAAAAPPRVLSSGDPGRFALITLTLINLLNYIDRYVPSATKQYFQADLNLDDTETSVPLTAFVLVYMVCSPVFSYLADIGYARNKLIASGVVIWSVATAAGALAVNFWTLLLSRSLVGVGEAAYATIAPALLSDFYLPSQRNAVLSFFYLAIPIGSAMGYALGGEVGGHWGWRYAFLVSGAPGIVVALMCLAIREPPVGAKDVEYHASRRNSAADLMFGLNPEGMALEDELESEGVADTEFAVHSEIGGPAVTHPHSTQVHIQDADGPGTIPRQQDGTPILQVGSAVSGQGTSQQRARKLSSIPRSRSASASYSSLRSPPAPNTSPPPWKQSIVMLCSNPYYMYCTVGLTFVTFAAGGLADWFPSWMNRVHNVDKDTAAATVGAITCVGGILGTAFGSWLGEAAKGKIKQPYLGVSGLNLIVTCICAWLIMVLNNVWIIGALVFVAQICLWAYTGPINALTINCVGSNMRVRAFAFQIFLSHAFGDAISPTILGAVSDATNSIRTAMLIVPAAMSFGMLTWLIGWRRLANEDVESFDGFDRGGTAAAPHDSTGGRYRRVPSVGQRSRSASRVGDADRLREPLMHDAPALDNIGSVAGSLSYDSHAIHLKNLESQHERPTMIV